MGESMYPIMGAIKWQRTYFAMLASPLRIIDVFAGHLLWIAARVATAVTAYLVVMAAFGVILSPWAVFVLPAGILTGLAFAAPLMAFSVVQESDAAFPLLFRLCLVPLFLFSGVFFPISQLPVGLRVAAYVTPLWHGVDLCRQFTLGDVNAASAVGHFVYLLALITAGAVAGTRNYRKRLLV
jgi:lipooligosaccharide transport system permease protein